MQLLGFTQRVRAAARYQPAELLERPQGRHPAGSIGGHAVLALETAQGGLRTGTKDAVDAPRVEAELEQAFLQRGDVIADEGVAGERQQPVPEPPTGSGQRPVGLHADQTVDAHTPLLLEGTDGTVGLAAEVHLVGGEHAELPQGGLDLGYGRPGVATAVQQHAENPPCRVRWVAGV